MSINFARIRWALRGLPDLRLALTLYQISTHTMTRPVRAKKLWNLCKETLRAQVPGDFVECGVWMGGSAGIMAVTLRLFAKDEQRNLHLFDSFEGLPAPGDEDGKKALDYWKDSGTSENLTAQRCVAGSDAVSFLLFDRLRIPKRTVSIHQGWFQTTLPQLGPEPRSIAILRLDGDWYESTKICFDFLYDRVSPGGVILLDDYFCWEGCRKATDEFRATRGLEEPIIRIDSDSGYWIKNH